nr:hypothetical protein [Tanacetum cinerariifolium]
MVETDENTTNPQQVPPTPQAPHTLSTIKLYILKKCEYDVWAMKMEHYLEHTEYPIWEVIQKGNGLVQVSTDTNGQIRVLPPKTVEILARDREKEKVKSVLSQLETHGAGVSIEDVNQKFLRSLPSSWSQVSLIMRTKPGVDTLNFDDLYNNLRVFECDVKGSTGSSSSTQNVAFVSFDNTSSTNEVNTSFVVSTSSGHNSQKEGSSSYTDDLMYSFFANQSSGPQLDHEDLKQAKDNRKRPVKQDEHKAIVTIDEEGVDWTGHAKDDTEDYALMDFNSSHSGSDTEQVQLSTLCIKQFWTSAKVKTINDEVRIQALVDGKRVNIKESFIRCTLRLDDAEGASYFTNIKIFEGLAKMGFIQLIIKDQLGDMAHHKEIFDTPSLTKKVFTNMKRKKHKPKRKPTQEFKVLPTESTAKQNLSSPSNDPPPSGEHSLKLKELMDLYTYLSNKVLESESEVIDIKSTYQERIKKLEGRVERLKEENRVLKELKSVHSTDDANELVMEKEKSSKQGRKIADIDDDVLSMIDVNEEEPADVEEVLEVVKATKLMTEVVTTAGATKVSVPRKGRGVIIQDPEETTTTATVQLKFQAIDKGKAIIIKEPKPLKRQAQIELDEKVARQLEAKLNAYINWNAVIEQVKRNERLNDKQKMKEETEELKKHLQIVTDYDDDDVNTDATPLALKITIVGYKIHTERNKPYFKIIRADGNNMWFISFNTMLKNFNREVLDSLWEIIRDRFEKIKPKNYSDDYLLNTLKIVFEKPNVEASVWKDQKGIYGLEKVKS